MYFKLGIWKLTSLFIYSYIYTILGGVYLKILKWVIRSFNFIYIILLKKLLCYYIISFKNLENEKLLFINIILILIKIVSINNLNIMIEIKYS